MMGIIGVIWFVDNKLKILCWLKSQVWEALEVTKVRYFKILKETRILSQYVIIKQPAKPLEIFIKF